MRYCPSAVSLPQIQSYPATGVLPAIIGGRRTGGEIRLSRRSGSGVLGLPGFNETKDLIEDQDYQHSTPVVGKRDNAGRNSETSSEGRIGLPTAAEGIPQHKDAASIRDEEFPPDTTSASSSSSSSKSYSSPSSLYSTLQRSAIAELILTPGTPASSSPPTGARHSGTAALPHGSRRIGMMPCNLVQSHPLTTYRLQEICPNCRNARQRQDERLGLLKEGLKQLRISVEGIVAVEDIQERGRQAYIEEGE